MSESDQSWQDRVNFLVMEKFRLAREHREAAAEIDRQIAEAVLASGDQAAIAGFKEQRRQLRALNEALNAAETALDVGVRHVN